MGGGASLTFPSDSFPSLLVSRSPEFPEEARRETKKSGQGIWVCDSWGGGGVCVEYVSVCVYVTVCEYMCWEWSIRVIRVCVCESVCIYECVCLCMCVIVCEYMCWCWGMCVICVCAWEYICVCV